MILSIDDELKCTFFSLIISNFCFFRFIDPLMQKLFEMINQHAYFTQDKSENAYHLYICLPCSKLPKITVKSFSPMATESFISQALSSSFENHNSGVSESRQLKQILSLAIKSMKQTSKLKEQHSENHAKCDDLKQYSTTMKIIMFF